MDHKNYCELKRAYFGLKKSCQVGNGITNDINVIDKNIDDILNFIKENDIYKIKNDLQSLLENTTYCDNIIGNGSYGYVRTPPVDKHLPIVIGDKKTYVPIVIKDQISNKNEKFEMDIIDEKLYICGNFCLMTEALILMHINKLWHKTVHLPIMLGYSSCRNNGTINRIISMKYGLDFYAEINLSNGIYNTRNILFDSREIMNMKTMVSTIGDLFTYIYINKKEDGTIILPNGILCKNISKLYDYMCISYLATHYQLTQNNIYPIDMHPENIFVHWLNDASHYEGNNIKKVKNIVYKIKNKYYNIETYGFVIILGDVGLFMIDVRDDIILIGQMYDVREKYKLIRKMMTPEYSNTHFLLNYGSLLSQKEYSKTIAYKINSFEPYCHITNFPYEKIIYLDKLKSTIELLQFYYDKYGVEKYIKSKSNILIEIP
jgi:hypothetical protein